MPWLRSNLVHHDSTDLDLILEYQRSGESKPIGILFNRYTDLVYGVCLKYLRSPEDAEDAVMQIFELVMKKLKSHDVRNFKSWLHIVSKNYCFETFRKRKLKYTSISSGPIVHSDVFVHHDNEFEIEMKSNTDDLADCMANLPMQQYQAVDLFYLQGKSYKEIADMTGEPREKIRSYIQNGRRNLKICMEKKNGQKS